MNDLLISKIKEYIPVSDTEVSIIHSLFELEEYKANETLLKEGTICNKMWFIEKGLIRFTTQADGEDRTFIFRNEGCFISDIEGLIQHTPATKSIIAIEDCRVYAITQSNLQLFFRDLAHGERFGRLLVERIFVAAVNHIVSFYTESPETRYIKLIKQNKDFLQRIPQYHIASFLGIKPQSLCRIKKRLLSS